MEVIVIGAGEGALQALAHLSKQVDTIVIVDNEPHSLEPPRRLTFEVDDLLIQERPSSHRRRVLLMAAATHLAEACMTSCRAMQQVADAAARDLEQHRINRQSLAEKIAELRYELTPDCATVLEFTNPRVTPMPETYLLRHEKHSSFIPSRSPNPKAYRARGNCKSRKKGRW